MSHAVSLAPTVESGTIPTGTASLVSEPPATEPQSAGVLSDAEIEALTDEQRAELMLRLHRDVPLPGRLTLRAVRRARMALLVLSAVVLVPWIVHLAGTLPTDYEVHHWTTTWVGYDIGLALIMAVTVVLGLLRSPLVILTSFSTGVLLLSDAWFDIVTASPADRGESILSAVFAEVPIALLLMLGALRILRHMAVRTWRLEPGQSIWRWRMIDLPEPG